VLPPHGQVAEYSQQGGREEIRRAWPARSTLKAEKDHVSGTDGSLAVPEKYSILIKLQEKRGRPHKPNSEGREA
jgi:hypothetical protein